MCQAISSAELHLLLVAPGPDLPSKHSSAEIEFDQVELHNRAQRRVSWLNRHNGIRGGVGGLLVLVRAWLGELWLGPSLWHVTVLATRKRCFSLVAAAVVAWMDV